MVTVWPASVRVIADKRPMTPAPMMVTPIRGERLLKFDMIQKSVLETSEPERFTEVVFKSSWTDAEYYIIMMRNAFPIDTIIRTTYQILVTKNVGKPFIESIVLVRGRESA